MFIDGSLVEYDYAVSGVLWISVVNPNMKSCTLRARDNILCFTSSISFIDDTIKIFYRKNKINTRRIKKIRKL